MKNNNSSKIESNNDMYLSLLLHFFTMFKREFYCRGNMVAMEHLQHEISTERINLHSHNTKDIKSYFLQKHHVSQRKKMTSGYARSDSKNKIINNKKRSKEKGRNTV